MYTFTHTYHEPSKEHVLDVHDGDHRVMRTSISEWKMGHRSPHEVIDCTLGMLCKTLNELSNPSEATNDEDINRGRAADVSIQVDKDATG